MTFSPVSLFSVALVAAFALPAAHASSGKAARPVEELAKTCATCHGADGKTPIDPSYAILAGQYPDYLLNALKDYKRGARKNAIMAGQAATLSNAEMEALAEYYGQLPGPLNYAR